MQPSHAAPCVRALLARLRHGGALRRFRMAFSSSWRRSCPTILSAYATGISAPYPAVPVTEFNGIIVAPDAIAGSVKWVSNGGALIKSDDGEGAIVDVVYPATES
jgi:hypothetical protein